MFDRANFLAILAGAAGGGIAIASMEAFSITTAFPLVAIPFATSIVTVLGSPKAEPAQPRALIGGHLISTLVGLLVVKLFGPNPWAAAMVVGLAMVAMHLSGTFHPPAGIDPLVLVLNNMSWSFLVVPVGIGALLLVRFYLAQPGRARGQQGRYLAYPLVVNAADRIGQPISGLMRRSKRSSFFGTVSPAEWSLIVRDAFPLPR